MTANLLHAKLADFGSAESRNVRRLCLKIPLSVFHVKSTKPPPRSTLVRRKQVRPSIFGRLVVCAWRC